MKKNIGTIDRILRILMAMVIITFYFTEQIVGTPSIIGIILSVVFVITSFVSFCPLYLPFGLSTRYREEK